VDSGQCHGPDLGGEVLLRHPGEDAGQVAGEEARLHSDVFRVELVEAIINH
jgi:hypothetical protein